MRKYLVKINKGKKWHLVMDDGSLKMSISVKSLCSVKGKIRLVRPYNYFAMNCHNCKRIYDRDYKGKSRKKRKR